MGRIVHICPRYAPARGGAETFFEKLSVALAHEGHDVEVWTTDALTVPALIVPTGHRLPAGAEQVAPVTVRRFPVRYVPLQRWTRTLAHLLPFGDAWKCNTLRWTPWVPAMTTAAATDPGPVDLVHVAGLPYSSLLHVAVRLADRTGARLVMTPFTHVPAPGRSGSAMRRAYLSPRNVRMLRRADAVFVQTAREQAMLEAAGIPAAQQAIVGVGISHDDVRGGNRTTRRSDWRVPPDAVVVGHLGNKSWDKGTVDLIAAAERLWTRGLTFHLVLAGPSMPGFELCVARSPFRDRIVDLPALSAVERRDFFAAIDVFALPSYVESFGLSALEAASCGAAVVAYDHGGPGEIFEDGVSALLPAAADVEALATAIASLVEDPTRRRQLAEGGQRVAARHDWSGALGRARSAYLTLLQPGVAPA